MMLLNLPQELLLQIHIYALNPFFPQTHPVVHSAISSPTPTYGARYLLTLYQDYGAANILVRSLRHPICNTSVAREVRRIWDKRRGYVPPRITIPSSSSSTTSTDTKAVTSSASSCPDSSSGQASRERAQTPQPTAPALTCSELPRRLFRHTKSETIDPLLTYLFETYSPSANSHKGYPLCRGVLTSNYALIELLLHHGADPSLRSHLALETAIKRQDLKAVKMLVERKEDDLPYDDVKGRTEGRERRRKKRRRMSDRIIITPKLMQLALEEGCQDIVNYFVEEKGIVPPLRGILSLTTPSKSKRKNAPSRRSADVFSAPRYA